ncbi:MAG: ornithine carbamoyltransferase, partial [Candidatus Bathyarchaeia archaeon]
GGHPIYMDVSQTQLGRGEPIGDFARVLSRYVHCIVARVFKQTTLEEMARYSDKPVINALSDDFHPTQLLADLMTILEFKGSLNGIKVAFVGDGSWNMANTWLYAAAKVGIELMLACPSPLRPRDEYLTKALKMADDTGAKIEITSSPRDAVEGADVVYTDVWTSMGQEAQRASMMEALSSYTVNKELLTLAKPDAIFMHPLPAHRGEEVEDDVIEGCKSVVFDQSENKLHVAKAILHLTLSGM